MNMNISPTSRDNKQSYNSDYSTNRLYSTQKNDVGDQYSDFTKRKDSFGPNLICQNELSSSQGTLYSVSQRLPAVNASCTSLCNVDPKYDAKTSQDWGAGDVIGKDDNHEESASEKLVTESAACRGPASANGTSSETIQGPIITICVYLHNKTAIMMEIEDTPTASVELICHAIVNCDELGVNKHFASQVFTLWMVSPLLELQLKRSQKPYEVRKSWRYLVENYSHASYNRQERDEPKLMFQRNVFYSLSLEEKLKDPKILELLYEEAKNNIINGRYPCEVAHYIMLGGVQAHIELGPYNPQVHSIHYFREEQHRYLPMHVRKSSTWTWLPISYKNSPEVRLLEHYKRVPSSATVRKLMKKYLEFCWTLPFYGAAFFEGQIEQPIRSLTSLITYHDTPVLVAINPTSVYVIDDMECTVLLGLRYEDLSWEYARPSKENDPNCLPCLFLQFMTVENGARVSKILQIFSRQACLMDNLIAHFVEQSRQKPMSSDETDGKTDNYSSSDNMFSDARTTLSHSSSTSALTSLSNKLSRLTLATFDENGHCIGQMGSWAYSY